MFFPWILESLPPLPRQHSAAIGCTKIYQPIGLTIHSHWAESFEGPLKLCRQGKGCSELWKKHNFSWTPCMSGYVVKRICEKLSCEDCKLSLKGHQKQGLIFTREYNSEQKNPVSFLIVRFVLQNLFSEANCKRIGLGKKYFFDYVNIKIVNTFITLHSVMMKTMDSHCYEC